MWNWEKIKEKHMYILWGVWAIVIVILLYKYKWPCSLNEWGDFLAGIVSPVALIMLVLGYRQQKEELKLNTAELARQAEQQTKQAEQLAKQTEILEFQQLNLKGPDLHFSKAIINEEECITITNKGAMAIGIRINASFRTENAVEYDAWFMPVLSFKESNSFRVSGVHGQRGEFDSKCFYVMYVSLKKTKYSIKVTSINTNEYDKEFIEIDP